MWLFAQRFWLRVVLLLLGQCLLRYNAMFYGFHFQSASTLQLLKANKKGNRCGLDPGMFACCTRLGFDEVMKLIDDMVAPVKAGYERDNGKKEDQHFD